MGQTRGKVNLREPSFLLWLGQFVGEWRLEGEVQVRRRDDGFLEVFSADTREKVPLDSVLRHGELVEKAQSPLGPYPAVLSAALMKHWLAPEECSRLRNAWRVGSGIKAILTAIEKSIAELPQPERDQRWLEWWAAGAASLPPLSDADLATHRMLYRRYRRAAQPVAEADCDPRSD